VKGIQNCLSEGQPLSIKGNLLSVRGDNSKKVKIPCGQVFIREERTHALYNVYGERPPTFRK
jgi:hypothetical protein